MLCVCVFDREIESERRAIVEVDVVMLLRPSGFLSKPLITSPNTQNTFMFTPSENDYPTLSNE